MWFPKKSKRYLEWLPWILFHSNFFLLYWSQLSFFIFFTLTKLSSLTFKMLIVTWVQNHTHATLLKKPAVSHVSNHHKLQIQNLSMSQQKQSTKSLLPQILHTHSNSYGTIFLSNSTSHLFHIQQNSNVFFLLHLPLTAHHIHTPHNCNQHFSLCPNCNQVLIGPSWLDPHLMVSKCNWPMQCLIWRGCLQWAWPGG